MSGVMSGGGEKSAENAQVEETPREEAMRAARGSILLALMGGDRTHVGQIRALVMPSVEIAYNQGRDDEHDRMIMKGYRDTSEDFCCTLGCGSGACESCPCCCAGWCVGGRDGIPGDENNPGASAEDQDLWLEVAAEHNPIAAALLACREQRTDLLELLAAERSNPPGADS